MIRILAIAIRDCVFIMSISLSHGMDFLSEAIEFLIVKGSNYNAYFYTQTVNDVQMKLITILYNADKV